MDIDRSVKKVIIPEGITVIPNEAFKDFKELEEIIIHDSVTEIKDHAFSGCSNLKKIILPKNLKHLGSYVFSNCKNLEVVIFPNDMPLSYFNHGLFNYCTNLKTLNIPNNVTQIFDYALFNCRKLKLLNIPDRVSRLGIKSFSGTGLKSLYIPKNLSVIELGALSNMLNLETIEVSKDNPRYTSDDSTSLIDSCSNILIQYALNSKNKEYELQNNIECIGEYAFLGSRHLECLTIPSCTNYIGVESLNNCNKLKKLNIKHNSPSHMLLSMPLKANKSSCFLPFEEINIEHGVEAISSTNRLKYSKLKRLNIPESVSEIESNIFHSSKYIEEVILPKNIESVGVKSFPSNTKLVLKDGINIYGRDLRIFERRNDYIVVLLKDGTYHIYTEKYDRITININDIKEFSNHSEILKDNPEKIINYLSLLLKTLPHKALSSIEVKKHNNLTNEEEKDCITKIIQNKNRSFNPLLDGILIDILNTGSIQMLFDNYNEMIESFLINSQMLSLPLKEVNKRLLNDIPSLVKYCKLLEKYNIKDRFLMNPIFVLSLSFEEQEILIKEYDPNIKRLITSSEILTNIDTSTNNMKDLFKFSKIMGMFEGHPILKQKVSTFITEKIFENAIEYRIVSDDIHRIFDTLKPRNEFDSKFMIFFIENYKELIENERTNSGFISRIYDMFIDIMKTHTSDKGSQRKLKVTVEKCINFISENKFKNINPDNRNIADKIGMWFDNQFFFDSALSIIDESVSAPRNIFDFYSDGNKEAYHNPDTDLTESIGSDDFTYSWLPKQDIDNLLLGKYCSCCAHLSGSGAGIMRASMVDWNCQNLVVRDHTGRIVSKATIYVNRKDGYAVYNTIETNLDIVKDIDKVQRIYKAFVRGTNAFMDKYNENYGNTLKTITVGVKRNTLNTIMDNNDIHPSIESLKPIDYSIYKYSDGVTAYGEYAGDSYSKQRLVLRKTAN